MVLIGAQGGERILAEEVARRLDTINYEVTCGADAAGAPPARAVTDAWIVGGALRDELLGRPVRDVDVAVAGDPERAARALAARGARAGVPAVGGLRRLAGDRPRAAARL